MITLTLAMFAALIMEFVMWVGTPKQVHRFVQPIQDNIPYFLTVGGARGEIPRTSTLLGG
jgi:hypothetical protein